MTGAERLDYLVRLAMEAWDTAHPRLGVYTDRWVDDRRTFAAAVRERLAQGAQVIECQLADAKDAGRAEGRAGEAAAAERAYRLGVLDAKRGPA